MSDGYWQRFPRRWVERKPKCPACFRLTDACVCGTPAAPGSETPKQGCQHRRISQTTMVDGPTHGHTIKTECVDCHEEFQTASIFDICTAFATPAVPQSGEAELETVIQQLDSGYSTSYFSGFRAGWRAARAQSGEPEGGRK